MPKYLITWIILRFLLLNTTTSLKIKIIYFPWQISPGENFFLHLQFQPKLIKIFLLIIVKPLIFLIVSVLQSIVNCFLFIFCSWINIVLKRNNSLLNISNKLKQLQILIYNSIRFMNCWVPTITILTLFYVLNVLAILIP